MKLETFFEKFDQFAEAPDAVAKMRELIMWSAFSGAFSTEERKQSMPEEWAVEGAPTLPSIPSSWKWQRGSEVFDVIRGVSYKKSDASDSPVEGSFPVLRANNIGNGINFDGLVYVPRDNIRDEQFVQRGDILIAMSSGSKKLVGKAAPIVTDFIGSFGAFCGIIRNKSTIRDEVLARYFQSPQYTSWVTAAGRGIGINNLGKRDLDSLPVPTPPLAEQKRIVAKVDELMALCDRLDMQQQERETRHAALADASLARFAEAPTAANLQFLFHPTYTVSPTDLRKSILTLAIEGKLVPQDPSDEPAQGLLEAIQKEKHTLLERGLLKKIQRVDFDCNGASDLQPQQWRLVTLAEICVSVSDGDHLPPPKAENGIPFLVISNVRWGGINFGDCRYVSDDYFNKLDWIRKPLEGDILYTLVGSFGIPVIVQDSRPFCVQRHIGILRPSKHIDRYYLAYALASDFVLQQATAIATGIAQKTVPLAGLRKIKIPLPPLAEQRRIVAKVNQLMTLVDALRAQLATARTHATALLEALVSELTSEEALAA